MKKIYFDHSATTPLDPKVLEEMIPYLTSEYGNASSIHSFGQSALTGVDLARKRLADFLHCQPKEIVFTSGATESDNLAIKGFVQASKSKTKEKIHIITSIIEHEAILQPCLEVEQEGVEVTYLSVDKHGLVSVENLVAEIRDNTALVSVMYVNNEVGTIEPIREIGKVIHKINEKRNNEWKKNKGERGERPQKIYFHTDATQAIGFCDCDVDICHIDMLSLSAHKIYGPKGVGALYRRSGTPLVSLQKGGHHENNLRSGTLNVPGIVGLGAAINLVDKDEVKKIAVLRDMLADEILKKIPDTILNTNREISSPYHAHFSFLGIEGESLLMSLDLEGIAVSTGSACAANSLKASYVLIALGIPTEVAHNSIRFTLGKNNTEDDIKKLMEVLPPIVERLRKMNPIYNK